MGHQLAIIGQTLQRFSFENRPITIVEVIEHLWFEHEEAAVDPPFAGLRFFGKLSNRTVVQSRSPSRHNG